MTQSIYRTMAQQAIKNVIENCGDGASIGLLIDAAYPFASEHSSLLKIWNEEKKKALALLPQSSQQITPVSEQLSLWS